MIRVIEAFSGIGSQAKALKKCGIEHEIVSTIEWDINATIAYDIIHNGSQELDKYLKMSKSEIASILSRYTLSANGKEPIKKKSFDRLNEETLCRLACAMERTNNLSSITNVNADTFPENIDMLTYSFPCQDLSLGGSWSGNKTGIRKDVKNRSGMLWEVERIINELSEQKRRLPTFLVMENVSNILSKTHKSDFFLWTSFLKEKGYENKVYTLNASKFGVPQKRVRTYMVSVFCSNNETRDEVVNYFNNNDLEEQQIINPCPLVSLDNFLRTNYSNAQYKKEAESSSPNNTPSRIKIMNDNDIIFDGENTKIESIKTITTKQDRNPNSGVILFKGSKPKKAPFRYLTPRECFLLMGFDEVDYQILIDNDFKSNRGTNFFTKEKLLKLAGNSIVVDVLERIFEQINYIKTNFIDEENKE